MKPNKKGNKMKDQGEMFIYREIPKNDEPIYLKEGDKVNFAYNGQMLTGEIVLRSNMHYAVAIDDYIFTMERWEMSLVKPNNPENQDSSKESI